MGARDLRASQGKVVGRDYPNLHRGIRARVIACERAEERSSEKPHGRNTCQSCALCDQEQIMLLSFHPELPRYGKAQLSSLRKVLPG